METAYMTAMRPKPPVKALTGKNLAERLRNTRKLKGWTQQQLADKVGVTQTTIQKIEIGVSLQPRKINEIAGLLGVKPAWLLFGEENPALSKEAISVARAWSQLPARKRAEFKKLIFAEVGR